MTPLLHPSFVNDCFGDPALYVEFLFEKPALLFDLGDLHALEPQKILRLSDILVSHTHLDHFIGFDQVLRVLIGREKRVRLYGPAGFIDRVAHKLSGYSWNLANRYSSELVFEVTELDSDSHGRKSEFRISNAFPREADQARLLADRLILDDGVIKARAAVLDHRIPCLAFAIEEKVHVNVWKNSLDQFGLPNGLWLRKLKQAVLRGEPDHLAFRAWWHEAGEVLKAHDIEAAIKAEVAGAACPGAGLFLTAHYQAIACGFSALDERGKRAEQVGETGTGIVNMTPPAK